MTLESVSKQNRLTCPWWPLPQGLLSLLRSREQLAKAVDRGVQTQEMFEYAREQVDPSANVLLFVKFDFHQPSAHEPDAVLGNHAREVATALQMQQAGNLFLLKGGLTKIVKVQDFLQGFF